MTLSDPGYFTFLLLHLSHDTDNLVNCVYNLSAEGGCFLKLPGKSTWDCQIQEGSDMQWRKKVMEVKCHSNWLSSRHPFDLDLGDVLSLTP